MAGDTDNTKTVCFDLDGTLCTNTYGAYDEAEPFPWAIERLNALAEAGHRIVVFTARGTATGIDWTDVTRGQLDSWGVRYDDVKLGKPSADVYVDDRAVHTTAWREGDAFAVPGFGLPVAADAPEELPGVLSAQRTTVVESGRTWGGRALLGDAHVERVRTRAQAAGIADVPSGADVRAALDDALARAGSASGELVFTIALADGVSPAFLDLAAERASGAVVTVRPLEYVLDAPRPEAGLPGRHAAVVDGALALAEPGSDPGPLASCLEDLARAAGLEVAPEPLTDEQRAGATESFQAVEALGLLPTGGEDSIRSRLDQELQARQADGLPLRSPES